MSFVVFTDFELGDSGMRLSDFGGVLINDGESATKIVTPNMTVNTTEIQGIDGQIPLDAKFDPRVIPLNIYIDNPNFNEQEFKAWLQPNRKSQWFKYVGDNRKIKGMFLNQVEFNIYNHRQCTVQLELTCHDPFWVGDDESQDAFVQNNPTLNTIYNFQNNGFTNCKPLIKFTVNSTTNIRFQFNNKIITIKNVVGDVFLDSRYRTAYTFVNSKKMNLLGDYECTSGNHKYDFADMTLDTNKFTLLEGSVANVTINFNSKYI